MGLEEVNVLTAPTKHSHRFQGWTQPACASRNGKSTGLLSLGVFRCGVELRDEQRHQAAHIQATGLPVYPVHPVILSFLATSVRDSALKQLLSISAFEHGVAEP